MTKIDPRLATTLRLAAADHRKPPVEAYVQLSFSEAPGSAKSTESAEAIAFRVLERVEQSTGIKVLRSQYLDLLDSIHLLAPAAFVLALIEQPEVGLAGPPPEIKGSAMIEPMNPRVVRDDDID